MILDDLVKASQVLMAFVTAGLLVVGVQSLEWAKRTFARQEEHEAAKHIAYTAFRVFQLPQPSIGTVLPEFDFNRLQRWWTNYNGRGWGDVILPAQWVTCYLTNLGPGIVSTAEIPYTVYVYDYRPVDATIQPAESIPGRFRFFNVPPGKPSPALTALVTTFYPFFRIQLGEPTIRDISGRVVVVPPDAELTQKTTEWDNAAWWPGFVNQQRAQRLPPQT